MADPMQLSGPLTVAVSPCPNDTFIFGAWVLGHCPRVLCQDASFVWEDVQVLNEAAAQGVFDVVKVSAAQALKLQQDYQILSSGGAFSTIYGPKLVTAIGTADPQTIAVPGMQTTAVAILRQAWSRPAKLVPVRYDRIVEMVQQGKVDAGLLIHESALLLERYGLSCLLDIGRWWREQTKGLPLPLGCILGRRNLGQETLKMVGRQIQASLNQASLTQESIWPLVQALAQELDDEVIQKHIRTYVNHFSRDMGLEGREALAFLGDLIDDLGPRGLLTLRPSPV